MLIEHNPYQFTKWYNLAGYLISHPNHWPDYVTKCAFTKKSPMEQELPWLSLDSIEFLEEYLDDTMKVLEFGGGGSTLFFANRVNSVLTIEGDQGWIEQLNSNIKKFGINNVTIKHSPLDASNPKEMYASDYINTLPSRQFDVILVDGPEIADFQARPVCFEWAERHVKKGGLIIVDDSWRYTQLRTQNKAKSHKVYMGIGPCRKGLTSTDIYFY